MTIKTWQERMPKRLPEGILDAAMMQRQNMADEIDELRAEVADVKEQRDILFESLAELKAQEPVATVYKNLSMSGMPTAVFHCNIEAGTKLFATPVQPVQHLAEIDLLREEFEVWAKSKHLCVDQKVKDAWGQDKYLPHIESMWVGWQAALAAPLPDLIPQDDLFVCGQMGANVTKVYAEPQPVKQADHSELVRELRYIANWAQPHLYKAQIINAAADALEGAKPNDL